MNAGGSSVLLNRGDYLGYLQVLGLTPVGEQVVGWSVVDLSDLTGPRAPFAFGQAITGDLALVCMAQASRERMSAPKPDVETFVREQLGVDLEPWQADVLRRDLDT